MRLCLGYPSRSINVHVLPNPGDFHWRRTGDTHMWDPAAIADLQGAARGNSEDAYWRFADHINRETTRQANLRGLLTFRVDAKGTPPVEGAEGEKDE